MKTYRVIYVDAFTPVPYAGNPCAVLPHAEGLSDCQMQAIARETNLSETSFVLPSDRADFRVRYFTPRGELPFAGHPTIATAFALALERLIPLQEPVTRIYLEFQIGVLPVDIHLHGQLPKRVVMTQQGPQFGQTFAAAEAAPCFSLEVADLRSDCPPQVVSTGVPFLIVPARDLAVLQRIEMQRASLADLCGRAGVAAAFMFCVGGFKAGVDLHARLFDPRSASEDPFTGAAMGCAAAYALRWGLRTGPHLQVEQGHIMGRPGEGTVEIVGSGAHLESVKLGGEAARALDGVLYVPDPWPGPLLCDLRGQEGTRLAGRQAMGQGLR